MAQFDYTTTGHPDSNVARLNVEMALRYLKVFGLDAESQILSFFCEFEMSWTDPRLSWNPEHFNDTKFIFVTADLIWTPDNQIGNTKSLDTLHPDSMKTITLSSNGTVHLPMVYFIEVACVVEISRFPFDNQTCPIPVATMALDLNGQYSSMTGRIQNVNVFNSLGNGEWDVIGVAMVPYQFLTETVHTLLLPTIFLKRVPNYYVYVIALPGFILTMLGIFGMFWTPHIRKEQLTKLSIGLTTLVSMTVLLDMLSTAIPKTSVFPLLGIYVVLCLAITINGTPLCVNFGKTFTVLLDFAVFCDFKQGDSWASVPGNCTNLLNPFYIDDVRKPFEECKKSLRNGKLLMNCQSHLKKSFTIYWVNDYDLDASAAVHRSAFSFRLAELIDDKIGYHLEPFDAPMNPPLTPSLSLNWTNVSQPTWIALSTGKGLNYLQKLQTISDNPNCSYELITGAPPAKNDYEKRKLMKFNDSQPFIVQFLENNLYSLFVPSNCAVTIEIDKDERSEGNWYNEKQTICDGEAIVTTPAYSNELSCFPDAYYLQRVVQCADPIDVSVEVVALLSGKMSIEFGYTKTNKTKITLSTSSNLFCKHSGIGVKSVTVCS
ncbi:unnamed protein product, partial [Mesorhabditis belari]|uniref:Neurotransmitter-gated ion-channel ligand-binding domain-containing protein n=1 Tax=Mesorhabditis belari TaxID=2138241 RepID=A0AAF3EE32_9BILA